MFFDLNRGSIEMIVILVGLFFVTGASGGVTRGYPLHFDTMSSPVQDELRIATTDRMPENYNEILTVANREEIREEKTSQLFLNKLKEVYKIDSLGRPQKIEESAYLLVKTLKHRNKRYSSYLTLCHFKICNMGRKRNSRYRSINEMVDNDVDYYK